MLGISDLFTSVFHFFTAYYFQESPLPESFKSQAMKDIVILGGACGAITTAHRIFHGAAKGTSAPFKITIVAPNTHLYWNLAAPRGAVGVYGDDKLFSAIAPGFKQYGDSFEFVVGTAKTLDPQAKTVTLADGNILEYDWLILATGSRLKEPLPFKGLGSTEATKEALHAFVKKVRDSEDIIIAGAGPTGIEFAGEVASEFPGKNVHLVTLTTPLFDNSKTSKTDTLTYPSDLRRPSPLP
jgi:NADH dehydrogenase FAD-containing subunit